LQQDLGVAVTSLGLRCKDVVNGDVIVKSVNFVEDIAEAQVARVEGAKGTLSLCLKSFVTG
jgi:hypothetical protein